jgi:DNA gyrase subunit A
MLIASKGGKSIRFPESQVRAMGRTAAGVRGISLQEGDEVVGMEILSPDATILTVTERGYGKRTPLDDYRLQRRGGLGVITIRTTARNGQVVGVAQVVSDDEVMLITDGGKVLRCPVSGISTMGRATQGVRVMDLAPNERLVSIARLAEADVSDADGGTGSASPS